MTLRPPTRWVNLAPRVHRAACLDVGRLKSGQSFMIAGLLQTQNDTTTQRIPGLGRIPVLGALFSSKAYQRRETDLVIIVARFSSSQWISTKKPLTPLDKPNRRAPPTFFSATSTRPSPGPPPRSPCRRGLRDRRPHPDTPRSAEGMSVSKSDHPCRIRGGLLRLRG